MPERQFRTIVDIEAPIERAWTVLTDFSAYGSWCPTHREIRGEAIVGGRLRLRLASEPGSDRTLAVGARVRIVEAPRCLAYGGGFPAVPALLDIHHEFHLEPLGPDRCRLTNDEIFRGLLLAPVMPLIESRVQRGYGAFNDAFRRRCTQPA